MYGVQPEATVRGNIQYSTLIISSVNGMIFLNISHIEIYWSQCYLLRKGKWPLDSLWPPVGFVRDFYSKPSHSIVYAGLNESRGIKSSPNTYW